MRFPFAVVTALFAMPEDADRDVTPNRRVSTFQRTRSLLASISGRADYTAAGERFEDIVLMLFGPMRQPSDEPWLKLFVASTRQELSEEAFFLRLRDIYNTRNPHAQIGIDPLITGDEDGSI